MRFLVFFIGILVIFFQSHGSDKSVFNEKKNIKASLLVGSLQAIIKNFTPKLSSSMAYSLIIKRIMMHNLLVLVGRGNLPLALSSVEHFSEFFLSSMIRLYKLYKKKIPATKRVVVAEFLKLFAYYGAHIGARNVFNSWKNYNEQVLYQSITSGIGAYLMEKIISYYLQNKKGQKRSLSDILLKKKNN